jgi:hypothetical protein
MSTRAVYTFKNISEWDNSEVHIYKHHDGYPMGGLTWIRQAYLYYRENHKTLKNLENRDALVTSFLLSINEDEGDKYGGCYITEHHEKHGDLEYRYEISTLNNFKESPIATNMAIRIYSTASWKGDEELIFRGNLAEAIAKFKTLEEVEA